MEKEKWFMCLEEKPQSDDLYQLLMQVLDRITLFFIAHKLILYGATVTYRITV